MATQNPYSNSLLMDAFRGSLSNAESLGRGFAVAPVGLLGDVNALARQYITPRLPSRVQGLLQAAPAAPTTEQILSNIPRASAPRRESAGMEQLGAAMNFKGPVDVARGAGRIAGNAVNEAMVYGRGPLASITPQPMRMDVYHGSPYGPFTKFDPAKVGSGEGGAMYGVGTNLAESPSFAQGYRELLSGDEAFTTVNGVKDNSDIAKMIGSAYRGNAENAVKALESKIPSLQKKLQSASKDDELGLGFSEFDLADMELQAQLKKIKEAQDYLGKDVKVEKAGYLYKVDLPDEAIAKMVNLDKPMSEQPKNVKDYFGKVLDRDFSNDSGWSKLKGSEAMMALRERLGYTNKGDFERALASEGITGSQYINESSGMGKGSSNFVVFPTNEDLLTIKAINGQPVGGLLD